MPRPSSFRAISPGIEPLTTRAQRTRSTFDLAPLDLMLRMQRAATRACSRDLDTAIEKSASGLDQAKRDRRHDHAMAVACPGGRAALDEALGCATAACGPLFASRCAAPTFARCRDEPGFIGRSNGHALPRLPSSPSGAPLAGDGRRQRLAMGGTPA